MKKSLLVLAIASTLAACGGGGGGGGGTGTTPITTNKNYGELYYNDQGGKLDISFQPYQLPSWIKNNNGSYNIDKADCENRTAELTGPNNSYALVIQTSKFNCQLPDFSNTNFLKYGNWFETAVDPLLRIFSNTINDSRISKVSGSDWPKKRGLDQIKFQLNPGDCATTDCTRDTPRERNEIAFGFSDIIIETPDPNKEYWLNFSFYVPTPYTEQGLQMGTNQEVTFFQIATTHQDNGVRTFYPFFMMGKKFQGDVTATTWVNDFGSQDRTQNHLIDDKNFEGHWHDVVVKYRANYGTTNTPSLQIWINGLEKVRYFGNTLSKENGQIYFKLGLYRPKNSNNPIQTIFFDEIRVGNTRAEVEIK